MENKNTLAENLVYQRKLKGFSQRELADRTNVTVRTIQRIEKGETEPHLQTVKLLAAALEIEVDELMLLEDPKEENIQMKWLLLLHSTPFIGFVIPLANIFIPLFLWIHKREDNKVYEEHGRKVINFQITMILFFVILLVMGMFVGRVFMGGGSLITLAVLIIPYATVVMLVNVFTAINSQKSYYPLSFPFIRKRSSNNKKNGRKLATTLLLFFFLSGAGFAQEIERLDGTTISNDSLTRHAEYLMEEAKVPGMGLAVFNNNHVVYAEVLGYGNNNNGKELKENTNMYGASLSKAVFTVIVMKLVEENVIDLDTPLESYLPKKIYEYEPQAKWHDDYSDLKNDSLYHKITARMSLAHTSGFPNWRSLEPDKKLRVKQEPGSGYMYSGEGMVYLQVVLEKITRKPFEELAQEIVFKPLGMEDSSFEWQPEFEADYAHGHNKKGQAYKKDKDNESRAPSTLETTFQDYKRFLVAVLNRKLLTDDSWKEIFSPQVRIRTLRQFGPLAQEEGDLNDDIEMSYGLGSGLFKTPYGWAVSKGGHGSGFEHYSVLFPEVGKGILIMTNSENGESIFKELLEVALKEVYTPWEWKNYIPYDQE
ncbi:CubicO group peptidase, beta-lactamase class C family [Salinimicrobium catena]|uniref:CubicO group peptidase, beta-lactamase class C family n=1 Tax=Salinimicrobium catena TaxID=390640 RepID=A0A1H5JVN0_9FLAO|nr:serine hydrolase [Salinimicrobium catena]SDK90904.1 CubicO group peptidase, beta-lactamase class C family [Salinimicrobium catena]SEE56532.1 CubicO group peptidase, beta-lactamase class C family [Salinimicrobium catena]